MSKPWIALELLRNSGNDGKMKTLSALRFINYFQAARLARIEHHMFQRRLNVLCKVSLDLSLHTLHR